MDKGKIIAIKSFNTAIEAEMVKSLLESAGINCSLVHEMTQSILPIYGNTGVDLYVAAEDEKRAREIISAKYDKEDFAEQTKSPEKPKRSCACGPKRK